MTRTVWLASYPKSGNTWLRMLIANLSAADGQAADINDLPERGGIASSREMFDHLSLIESGVLTHDEADRLRPLVYEEFSRGADIEDDAEDTPPVRFVKVHDAYTLTQDGVPLLGGARGAEGAVLIVRDPRDVAPSLAHHNRSTLDAAINFMGEPKAAFCSRRDRQDSQLRQKLPGWSGHAASWLEQRDVPVHLVRYEDLKADAAGALAQVLAFAGRAANADEIARAVALADFSELKKQEAEKGFRERPQPHAQGVFFRRGEAGGWRDELSAEQAARIEAAHGAMMRRLGYTLSNEAAA